MKTMSGRRFGASGVERVYKEDEGVEAEVMDMSARRGRAGGCGVTTARLRLCSGSRGRGSKGGERGRERVREF